MGEPPSQHLERYRDFLKRRHRPAHGRRTAARWASFLAPHLRPDMRVLDVGCGPGSISVGLTGRVVGVDLHATVVEGVPTVSGDGSALPFADASFDAAFMNAVLQHVGDPARVLRQVRRVSRPGAVLGVGDADWGSRTFHPSDPGIDRGQQIQELVREAGDVRIGRQLRGLLTGVGYERVVVTGEARVAGSAEAVAQMAAFERAWFEAPEAVAHVIALGVSDPDEMSDIAAAWTRWSTSPAACSTDIWFTALGWAP